MTQFTTKMFALKLLGLEFRSLRTHRFRGKNVTKANVLHTEFLTKHNFSMKTAEHLRKTYPKIFPDSKIAKLSNAAEQKQHAS